jgi:hypothetical protein
MRQAAAYGALPQMSIHHASLENGDLKLIKPQKHSVMNESFRACICDRHPVRSAIRLRRGKQTAA